MPSTMFCASKINDIAIRKGAMKKNVKAAVPPANSPTDLSKYNMYPSIPYAINNMI